MDLVVEKARAQRFTSIICRYPRFMVEDDEDEVLVERFHKRRTTLFWSAFKLISVEWERRALKRRGGYEDPKNNLFQPEGVDDLQPVSPVAGGEGTDEGEGEGSHK
jgi:hypothetical protein